MVKFNPLIYLHILQIWLKILAFFQVNNIYNQKTYKN